MVFEPVTKITSFSAISSRELVNAPVPRAMSRAATDEAWQSRVQLSMLLVCNAARVSFCSR